MNAKLDRTVPRLPHIHNQMITPLGIFAQREVIVLEEVKRQNDVLLALFSIQLETGRIICFCYHKLSNKRIVLVPEQTTGKIMLRKS